MHFRGFGGGGLLGDPVRYSEHHVVPPREVPPENHVSVLEGILQDLSPEHLLGPLDGGEIVKAFHLKGYDEITSIIANRYALSRISKLEDRLSKIKFYGFSSPLKAVSLGLG